MHIGTTNKDNITKHNIKFAFMCRSWNEIRVQIPRMQHKSKNGTSTECGHHYRDHLLFSIILPIYAGFYYL